MRRLFVFLTATAIIAIVSESANAQEVTQRSVQPDSAAGVASEIIVTAQKRSQRLSDVPISIVAATGQQLASAGVTDVSQLVKIAPGFQAATTFTGLPVFSLRGVNFNAAQISATPAVSMYVDEAPLPYTPMYGGLMLDVERVEVLKGPQGTLFGQNATGGSINIIAAKPTKALSAGFNADVNNFGQVTVDGYVSGPLTDTLTARLAGSTTQFGAWQRGYYQSTRKNGDQDKLVGRLLLDWQPVDNFKLSINLNANRDHGESQQPQLSSVNITSPANPPPGLTAYPLATSARDADFDSNINTHKRNDMYQASGRADWDVGKHVQLTSLSSYTHARFNQITDDDGTAVRDTTVRYSGKVSSFYQELRLSGRIMDGKATYIIGGNYQYDKIGESELVLTPYFSSLPPQTNFNALYDSTNRAIAAFANGDVKLTPTLSLSAGARYTSTRQTMKGCTRDAGNGNASAVLGGLANLLRSFGGLSATNAFVAGGCVTLDNLGQAPTYLPAYTDLSQSQHNIAWRSSVSYKPTSSTLLYGSVSRGYKSGTFPVQLTIVQAGIQPVSQEELTDYEVGIKTGMFDNKLRFEFSAFYYDYRNKQFYTYEPVPPVGNTSTVVNIPRAKVKGFEGSITAKPVAGLTVRGAVTYIKTSIDSYKSYNINQELVDASGKEFSFAPPLTATADIEYKAPLTSKLSGMIGGNMLYNAREFGDLGQQAITRLPAYTVFDVRAGIETNNGIRFSLWARNLTNKFYWTSISPGNDAYLKFAGMPRTFGASFGAVF